MARPHPASDRFMHQQPSCVIEEIVEEMPAHQKEAHACPERPCSTAAAAGVAAPAAVTAAEEGPPAAPGAAAAVDEAAEAPKSAADADAEAGPSGPQDSAEAGADAASAAAAAAGQSASTSGSETEPADEAAQQLIAECEALKAQANALYSAGDYDGALELYWQAIDAAPEAAPERAVYLGNAAACYMKKEMWQAAVEQCTKAISINPAYLKAIARRATALEQLDDLERALADAQRARELDPSSAWASATVARLEPEVQRRQERLKEEMLGKLKELGNTVLGKFGLSLDNFKAEQDPETGGYSIKFAQ